MKKQVHNLTRITCFIALFVGLSLITGPYFDLYGAEYVAPEDREAYRRALVNAENPTQAHVVTNLLAVAPGTSWINYNLLHADGIVWEDPDNPDPSRVLVVAFMNEADFEKYYEPYLGQEYDLTKGIWVTVVPELKNFFVGRSCPPTKERLRQALGLNPAFSYDALVEMYIRPSDLFRPSPDPEITDHQAELATRLDYSIWVFPSDKNAFIKIDENALFLDSPWDWKGPIPFKNWFMNRAETIYSREGEDVAQWGWPWTRLGYTYDWGDPDNPVGLSEFVVRLDPAKGKVNVKLVRGIVHGQAAWEAYFRCGPSAPILALETSGTGVSFSWSSVEGAQGYRLLYSPSERGVPFAPPFEYELDLGNIHQFQVDLPPGSCFYMAIQAYDSQGPGALSNLGYFFLSPP